MKILGHPLHIMVIHFPSALLPMDFVCSLLGHYTGHASFIDASFFALAGAVIFGGLAIITGAFDVIGMAERKPGAVKKALIHGGINGSVIIGYSVITFRAWKQFPDLAEDNSLMLIIKACLLSFMFVGNYLGGSLILKHKVGLENC